MKHWVEHLQQYFHQMNKGALRDLLQQHLNSQATCLEEVFGCHLENSFVNCTEKKRLTAYPILNFVYAYAPWSVCQELDEVLSDWDVSQHSYHALPYVSSCRQRLSIYAKAWDLIQAIQQNPYEIIHLVQQAKPSAVEAFKILTKGSLWARLAASFSDAEFIWSTEEKNQAIDYFKNPLWAQQCVEALRLLQEEARSYRALFLHQEALIQQGPLFCWQSITKYYQDFPFGADLRFLPYLVAVSTKSQESFLCSFLFQMLNRQPQKEQMAVLQHLPLSTGWRFLEYTLNDMVFVEQSDAIQNLFHLVSKAYSPDALIPLRKALYTLDKQVNGLSTTSTLILPQDVKGIDIETYFLQPHGLAFGGLSFLKQLIRRYRCMLLTLTAEEFIALLSTTEGLISYSKQLPFKMMMQTDKNEYPFKLWCIDRIIHGLLREAITRFRKMEDPLAYRALETIYAFYDAPQQMLRLDIFFGAIKHRYGITDYLSLTGLGIECTLFQWVRENQLADCLSGEVAYAFLYDEAGQCKAFIDEFNKVWHWSPAGMVLAAPGFAPQHYFNHKGEPIGCLSSSGHFQYHKNPVWQLILILFDNLPKRGHLNTESGLALLYSQSLWHHVLGKVYAQLPDAYHADKMSQQSMVQWSVYFLTHAQEALPYLFFERLASFLPSHVLPSVLPRIKNKENSLSCFQCIMTHPPLRQVFFEAELSSSQLFFLQHRGVTALTNYLACYDTDVDYQAGLDCLAKKTKKWMRHDWLAKSFSLLEEREAQGHLSSTRWSAIKNYWVSTEESAALMLQDFCADNRLKPIQEAKTKAIKHLLSHFNKASIVLLLAAVTKKACWRNSWQYRLFLYLVDEHQSQWFDPLLVQKDPWTRNELKLWAFFIQRHLSEASYWDKGQQAGSRLLSALLFYCAQSGLTSFFFNEDASLGVISKYCASTAFLNKIQTHLKLAMTKEWDVIYASASARGGNTPLLCLYLLYYTGDKTRVVQLLDLYMATYAKKICYTRPLAQWLMLFPQSDIAAVIFDGFQQLIIDDPSLLDGFLLHAMAHFRYKRTTVAHTLIAPQQDEMALALLRYWGHAKQYQLVYRAAELLKFVVEGDLMQRKLSQIIVEAKTELQLQHYPKKASLFHAIMTWCTRHWHYGLLWRNNLSQWVVLYDENASDRIAQWAPSRVKGLSLSSLINDRPVVTGWLSLLDQVIRSTAKQGRHFNTSTTVFFNPIATLSHDDVLDVAGQPDSPHV
ncbi:MAG: hypothetical protein CK426_00095 [Legionella sp.]|nr:MAG: hypothetical protein CK423_07925 [Legionella sp.]PJE00261.1 MAG: hypothetical protein CK426_00095 [Legionella sp.]